MRIGVVFLLFETSRRDDVQRADGGVCWCPFLSVLGVVLVVDFLLLLRQPSLVSVLIIVFPVEKSRRSTIFCSTPGIYKVLERKNSIFSCSK